MTFSNQLVGTTSTERTVTVTNTGGADLTVSAVTLGGTDPGQFGKGAETCTTAPIAPTATCTVKVTFAPTSAGNKTATLTFTTTAPGSSHSVTLTGTGTVTPQSAKKKQTLHPGLPHRIKPSGLTLITAANARTNAGQRVRTIIRGGPANTSAAGEVRYFTIVRGPHGKVSIRTFGHPDLKLKVTQKAPATSGHTRFHRTAIYLDGDRR